MRYTNLRTYFSPVPTTKTVGVSAVTLAQLPRLSYFLVCLLTYRTGTSVSRGVSVSTFYCSSIFRSACRLWTDATTACPVSQQSAVQWSSLSSGHRYVQWSSLGEVLVVVRPPLTAPR